MGQNKSLVYCPEPFDPLQWSQVPNSTKGYRPSYGSFTCLQHCISKQQMDRYEVQFTSFRQQQAYYDNYLRRFREEYIVDTLHYSNKSVNKFCGNDHKAEVYIPHMPLRLGDLTDIPYPDNIYVLRCAFKGFSMLYGMAGYFQITEDHFCINRYGEVKVWLNANLSKNEPEDPQIKAESDMVNRIIELVEKNTSNEQCPVQVSKYFAKKNKLFPRFTEALTVLDQYARQFKTTVPKYFESIVQIFNREHKPIANSSSLKGSRVSGMRSKSLNSQSRVIKKSLMSFRAEDEKSEVETVKFHTKITNNHEMRRGEGELMTRIKANKKSRIEARNRGSIVFTSHNRVVSHYKKLEEIYVPYQVTNKKYASYSVPKPLVRFQYHNKVKNAINFEIKITQPQSKQQQTQISQDNKQKRGMMCYYDTGVGTSVIDPEIAADLLQYL